MMREKWRSLREWWYGKSEQERKRLRAFIPLVLYTVAVVFGVIYLSILNSVNRYNRGETVKNWYSGDTPEIAAAREQEEKEMKESYSKLRKRVTGGR